MKKILFIFLFLFALIAQSATLEWDRNPETNVIGYRVYVGRVSRLYDSVLDIGNQITTQVPVSPGTTYFAVTAYDSDGLESDFSEEVYYTMPGGNSAPYAVADNYVAAQNTTLNVSATIGILSNDTDSEGDTLIAEVANVPIYGTVTLNLDGSFSYVPPHDFIGADSFTYRASDGFALSAVTTVNVMVNSTNITIITNNPPVLLPIAEADSYTTTQNVSLIVNAANGVMANDSNVVSVAIITPTAQGTFSFQSDGGFSYMPPSGYTGLSIFKYRAFNISNQFSDAFVYIGVVPTPATNIVIVRNDFYSISRNKTLDVPAPGILFNDTIGGTPFIYQMSSPSNGMSTLYPDGRMIYIPTTNFVGLDFLEYKVSAGNVWSASARITISVTNVVTGTNNLLTAPINLEVIDIKKIN